MKAITEKLLEVVSDFKGKLWEKSAYSVREDGGCAAIHSTQHTHITPKPDGGGLDITVDEGTQGETVYIPACITHGGVDEVVYNDFHIGKNADITIYAGCGVHVEGEEGSRHSGIHRFFLAEGAKVHYIEKHAGEGQGEGKKVLDPQTWFELGEGSLLEMDTTQLGGVDRTCRITKGKVGKDARLLVRERLLTEKDQQADSQFEVDLMGENSGCDLVSRAVAKDQSHQDFSSLIRGFATCTGHTACDALLMGQGTVDAAPRLAARCEDASLIHEAAIGKIAGEQLWKLQTLGLTREEAEERLVAGFLK